MSTSLLWPVARFAPGRLACAACRPLSGLAVTQRHARRCLLTVSQSARWSVHSTGYTSPGTTDTAASQLWQPRRGAKRRSKKERKEVGQATEQEQEHEDAGQDEEEIPEFDSMEAELKVEAALEYLAGRYSSLQTGRAAPALIEGVGVNAYEGAPAMLLPQLANITVRDPQTLAVQLYDPSIGNAVVKAIQSAGLDLNPSLENKSVIVPVPKMTADGRQSVIKTAGTLGEQTKQSIRVTRQESMKKLKRYVQAVSMSKDEAKKLEGELQAIIDAATKSVGEMVEEKIQELSS
jgi:ribosome recycling factor